MSLLYSVWSCCDILLGHGWKRKGDNNTARNDGLYKKGHWVRALKPENNYLRGNDLNFSAVVKN